MKALLIGLLLNAPSDSLLSPKEFARQVRDNHPSVLQSNLILAESRSMLLQSRSFSEPKFGLGYDRKRYDGKNYWNILESDFKVRTPLGVAFYGAFQQNSGLFLNPELNVPQNGLYAGGIEVPLGRNLWHNKGRLAILKARIGVKQAEFIFAQSVNETLLDAMSAYWNWSASWQALDVNRKAADIAFAQLQLVKASALIGERPIIDTLESHIQLQNRQITLRESEVDYTAAFEEIRRYIWNDSIYAKFEQGALKPQTFDNLSNTFELSVDSLNSGTQSLQNHPILKALQLKQDQLEQEIRYSRNQLLPDLNFKYNLLAGANEPFVAAQTLGTDFYKAAITLQIPIFLRKERAGYQLSKLYFRENEFKLLEKERDLYAKLRTNFYSYTLSLENALQMRGVVNNYYTLMRAEETRFLNGESSVFLINQRENMYFQSQVKLISLEAKWRMNLLKYYYSQGNLSDYLLP